MRVAAILACAVTVVLGTVIDVDIDIEIDTDLNELGCPINTAIQKIFAHKNCDMYNQCANGEIVEHKCSNPLLFNINTLECDWAYNVDCAGRNMSESNPEQTESPINENDDENDETCNCDPAEAPEICAQSGSDGVLVAHEYCTRLYKCAGGQPVTMRCPKSTFYNPYKKRCDWAENVVCGNRTIPEIEDDDNNGNDNNNENDVDEEKAINHDTPDASKICAQDGSNNVFIPHESCNVFYICSEGIPIAKYCPPGLSFNPDKKECDWPRNVDCGNKTIAETDESDGNDNNNDDDVEIADNHDTPDASEICAQDGSNNVFIPHESCNVFYICSEGIPIAKYCPPGLSFNPDKKECDWPRNVDCGNKTIAETDESDGNDNNNDDDVEIADNHDTPDASEICAQDGSNNVFIPHESCNVFYICSEGIPIAKYCPPGLSFNPDKNECDWPRNVDCGNKTIAETDESDGNDDNNDDDVEIADNHDTPDASEICAQDGSNNVLIPHESCNVFYICSEGIPIAKYCPPGLSFNPDKNECDWPRNVDCGNKTIAETDESDGNDDNNDDDVEIADNHDTPDASEICAQDGSNNVLIPHESCNVFYICSEGIPIAKYCPPGLSFNPDKNECDWPRNVDCGNKTIAETDESDGNDNNDENDEEEEIEGPINDNPAEAAAICAQNNTNGVLVAHQNCDEFYICNLYVPVAMRCADGLHFNPRKGRCDWPKDVDCGDRVIPERNNTQSENDSEESCNNCDPSEAPEICAREGSNGVLVAHENCNQYYKCYAGVPNVLTCINTLMFNPNKGWCDRSEYVDCGDRIIPDNGDSGNDNPAKASEICARAGSEGVLVAHEMCNQFYKCSHGEPIELECESGLQFDADMGLCNWPSNVDCGDRQQ